MIQPVPQTPLTDDPENLNFGPYMCVADAYLRLISVFDDLRYDRADVDMLSPAMRNHAIARLASLGFRQVSGTVVRHETTGVRCIMPKFHPLGASPFDITRYTPRGECDFYILTPTQTACQLVDWYSHVEAVERIKALITHQPINLYKLLDYLENTSAHQEFAKAIGHLRLVQREAVTSEPLRRRRALGSMILAD